MSSGGYENWLIIFALIGTLLLIGFACLLLTLLTDEYDQYTWRSWITCGVLGILVIGCIYGGVWADHGMTRAGEREAVRTCAPFGGIASEATVSTGAKTTANIYMCKTGPRIIHTK